MIAPMTGLRLFLLAVLLSGCDSHGTRATETPRAPQKPAGPAGARPYSVSYTAEQQALLAVHPDSSMTAGAEPVYPALDRFDFTQPAAYDPARARAATETIDRVIEQSPRLYVLRSIDPRLANDVGQYGPPPRDEPDPWIRVVATSNEGYDVAWATPSPEAESQVRGANAALDEGDLARAARAFEAAARASQAPGLWVQLARVQASMGDSAGALTSLNEALTIDSRYFDAHLERAHIASRSGDLETARQALAEALALYPTSPRAKQLVEALGGAQPRPEAPHVFIEVAQSGAIVVGSTADPGAAMYARCRAAVRYEPDLRASLLGTSPKAPYRLSMGEEIVCLEAMLATTEGGGTAGRATSDSPLAPADTRIAGLEQLAISGQLAAYALYDVIGSHRPEYLRLAPDAIHQRVVDYVLQRVLGTKTPAISPE